MKLIASVTACLLMLHSFCQNNVGIGTNAPNSKLHIKYNSTLDMAQLKLEEDQAGDFARLRFANTVSASRFWDIAGFIGATAANDRMNFYNSGAGDILSLTGAGNVGIATVTPNFKLDVNGSLNFNGPLGLFGNTGLAGQMVRSTGSGNAQWAYPTKLIADSSKLRYNSVYFDLLPGFTDVGVPGWFQRITLPVNARLEIAFNMIVEGVSCFACGDSYFSYFVVVTRDSDNSFQGGGNGYCTVGNGKMQSVSNVFVPQNILPAGNYTVDLRLTHISGPTVKTIAEIGSNFFIKAWYQ